MSNPYAAMLAAIGDGNEPVKPTPPTPQPNFYAAREAAGLGPQPALSAEEAARLAATWIGPTLAELTRDYTPGELRTRLFAWTRRMKVVSKL